MAEERYLTETLKYYTEVFRLMWISILAIGGGSIGLLLGENGHNGDIRRDWPSDGNFTS